MEKGGCVKVIEGEEVKGDDPVEFTYVRGPLLVTLIFLEFYFYETDHFLIVDPEDLIICTCFVAYDLSQLEDVS